MCVQFQEDDVHVQSIDSSEIGDGEKSFIEIQSEPCTPEEVDPSTIDISGDAIVVAESGDDSNTINEDDTQIDDMEYDFVSILSKMIITFLKFVIQPYFVHIFTGEL